MFRLHHLLFPAFLATVLIGSGCESLGGGGESDAEKAERRARNRAERADRLDRDLDRDRDSTVRIDRDGDVVVSGDRDTGRTTGRGLASLPRGARRVDSAQGTSELMYEARRDATIYVVDVDDDRVVYTGTVRDGDRFVLDPNDNTALLNGRTVLEKDLKTRHVYRLYVLDDRDRTRDRF